jgi:hypothetical protein
LVVVRTGTELEAAARFSNAWPSESFDAPGRLSVEMFAIEHREHVIGRTPPDLHRAAAELPPGGWVSQRRPTS